MSVQTSKNTQEEINESGLKGCENCPQHNVLHGYRSTDAGMTINCSSDNSPGLTLVADNQEECEHYLSRVHL